MCFVLVGVRVIKTCTMFCARICREYVQPIADRVAQNQLKKIIDQLVGDEHQVITLI